MTRLNQIRQDNRALQTNEGLHFHTTDNPSLIAYSKRTADGANTVLVIVKLDPVNVPSGFVALDLPDLGLGSDAAFEVQDLLNGPSYRWRGPLNYVSLRPAEMPAHIFRIA